MKQTATNYGKTFGSRSDSFEIEFRHTNIGDLLHLRRRHSGRINEMRFVIRTNGQLLGDPLVSQYPDDDDYLSLGEDRWKSTSTLRRELAPDFEVLIRSHADEFLRSVPPRLSWSATRAITAVKGKLLQIKPPVPVPSGLSDGLLTGR